MTAFQFRISLDNTSPEIWRRIQVSSEMDLMEFHLAIQLSMGWTNSHLYEFTIDGKNYQTPYEEVIVFEENKFIDSGSVTLKELLQQPGQQFSYLYDFGDSWQHTVVFEKFEPLTKRMDDPVCMDGENCCPPEDCGGLRGFYEMLTDLKSGDKKKINEYTKWLGKKFDPGFFDKDAVNKELTKINDWLEMWFSD